MSFLPRNLARYIGIALIGAGCGSGDEMGFFDTGGAAGSTSNDAAGAGGSSVSNSGSTGGSGSSATPGEQGRSGGSGGLGTTENGGTTRGGAAGAAGTSAGMGGTARNQQGVGGGADDKGGAAGRGGTDDDSHTDAGGTAGRRSRGSGGSDGGVSGVGGGHAGGSSNHAGGAMGSPDAGDAGSCPAKGNVTYTLEKAASPTAKQQSAYDAITKAMDTATSYYNCYTNITKALRISYVPSVQTADGNSNGSIRFGADNTMQQITAMHEIAHTVGIGTVSAWPKLVSNGVFTGSTATAQLREITGKSSDVVNADSQHFWPYGLNYTSEVKSNDDLVNHCKMVSAILKDMGQ